jgi:GAF domain-containing protein
MSRSPEDLLQQLGRLAADLGPALVPAGHHELLESITSAAKDLFAAAACSLALLDEGEETLVFSVASGEGATDVVGMRVPVGRGIAGWVVTSGQPIAIADVRRDPRFAADVAQTTGYVPRSILAMPLQTERRMIGAIEVLDRSSDGRDDRRDMQLLALFAEQAALAIENSRVFSDLGQALLTAAAAAAETGDLSEALEVAARSTPAPDAEMAEIGALFSRLGRAGPKERHVVTVMAREFLAYLQGRGKWT